MLKNYCFKLNADHAYNLFLGWMPFITKDDYDFNHMVTSTRYEF
jgi:hypothetical protein